MKRLSWLRSKVARVIGLIAFLAGGGSCLFAMEASAKTGAVWVPIVLFIVALAGGMVAIGDQQQNA